MLESLRARQGIVIVVAIIVGVAIGLGVSIVTATPDATGAAPAAVSMGDVRFTQPPVEPEEPDVVAEPSEPPPSDAPVAAVGTIDACRRTAALGELAVGAADVSLGNWKVHYGAQVALDEGEIDGAEAKQRWADSKAPATDDLTVYEDATAAFAADEGCDQVDVDALDAAERDEAQACRARAGSATETLVAAKQPTQDWLDHLDMMRRRDEFPIDEYLEIWEAAVEAAPAPMREFETASADFGDPGDCATDQVDIADLGLPERTLAVLTSTPDRTRTAFASTGDSVRAVLTASRGGASSSAGVAGGSIAASTHTIGSCDLLAARPDDLLAAQSDGVV